MTPQERRATTDLLVRVPTGEAAVQLQAALDHYGSSVVHVDGFVEILVKREGDDDRSVSNLVGRVLGCVIEKQLDGVSLVIEGRMYPLST